ncbi:DUF3999 family protein [Candidatus Thiothrix sp. Deng01]|uniref:DUF3999 family protein n=1 Tax=Candidatus Thiothrix phosphatis TaxID=3112415 RepID=A0ABU6CYN9_9GAMM|nr:DUF3999 family protein [Candidatus Thiothrix sp. Deng01]MEB4591214.1 DUF3999 family protein [Candidatus Thiothrix sp. Deng01]
MKRKTGWLLLMLLVGNAWAQGLTPQDFAFGANFAEGQSSLRQATLPAAVLAHIQHPDFADVRVFNADGVSVPFAIRSLEQASQQQEEKPLPFFPLEPDKTASPAEIKLELQQFGDEQHLWIDTSKQEAPPSRQPVTQYIIRNAAPQAGSLCQLRLDWRQSAANRVLPFTLETSQDLDHWETLASLSVSRLQHAGASLENRQVGIPCTDATYLRLGWQQPQADVVLTEVQGVYSQQVQQKSDWLTLDRQAVVVAGKGAEWRFDNPGILPISQIRLKPPASGLMYSGSVYSRAAQQPGEKEQWQYRGSLSQYRLTLDNTEVRSAPDGLVVSRDPFWKISLDNASATQSGNLPEISLGWQPDTVLFLAQGKPPFTLAYGNPAISEGAQGNLEDAVRELQRRGLQPEQVSLGEAHPLGDIELHPNPFPWKLLAMWLVLIGGTLLMAYMAYNLYRQMDKQT